MKKKVKPAKEILADLNDWLKADKARYKEWTELHKALHSPLWKFLDVVFISNYTREMTLDQALRLYAKSKKVKN
jgi:hypothetical protein